MRTVQLVKLFFLFFYMWHTVGPEFINDVYMLSYLQGHAADLACTWYLVMRGEAEGS